MFDKWWHWLLLAIVALFALYGLADQVTECSAKHGVLVKAAWGGYACIPEAP